MDLIFVVAELGGAMRIVTSARIWRAADRLALPIALRLRPIDLPRGLGLLNDRGDFDRDGFPRRAGERIVGIAIEIVGHFANAGSFGVASHRPGKWLAFGVQRQPSPCGPIG
jgi:hypothetical protein